MIEYTIVYGFTLEANHYRHLVEMEDKLNLSASYATFMANRVGPNSPFIKKGVRRYYLL